MMIEERARNQRAFFALLRTLKGSTLPPLSPVTRRTIDGRFKNGVLRTELLRSPSIRAVPPNYQIFGW